MLPQQHLYPRLQNVPAEIGFLRCRNERETHPKVNFTNHGHVFLHFIWLDAMEDQVVLLLVAVKAAWNFKFDIQVESQLSIYHAID